MSIEPGAKLGRYEIRAQIGEGGMGEVYRARDEKLNREVAIKILPVAFSQDPERLLRFEQEAQAAGALNHPNILSVYDVNTHGGTAYVVSELLAGESLRDRIGGAALSQRKAIEFAVQITHGLAAAHEKGIVHRDLKPDNLFITSDDRVKILDFGLAKLVQPVDENKAQTDVPTRKVHTDPGDQYAVTSDGQRFLINTPSRRGCLQSHQRRAQLDRRPEEITRAVRYRR